MLFPVLHMETTDHITLHTRDLGTGGGRGGGEEKRREEKGRGEGRGEGREGKRGGGRGRGEKGRGGERMKGTILVGRVVHYKDSVLTW